MAKTKIQVLDNGSYLVEGEFEVLDGEGNVIETKDSIYLCRCGLSDNMPFCTGAHKGKFESIVRKDK